MGSIKSTRFGRVAADSEEPRFSVEQANQALTLVQRIVSDLVAQYRHLEDLRRQRRALLQQRRRGDAEGIERQAGRAAARLDEFVNELSDLGVQLEDLDKGLVDFPGRRNSRNVLLCWKLGEPQVANWHDTNAGFADRRLIDEACE